MKEKSAAQKYRWMAAGLYGVLFVFQAYCTGGILGEATLANVPLTWLYAVLLMPVALGMAAWLFAGKSAVKEEARRAVAAVTAGCILFEWMSYSDQTGLINYTLYSGGSAWYDQSTSLFLLVCARLALLVLAAFLVMMSNPTQEAEQKGDVPEWVGEMEQERLTSIRAKKAEPEDGEEADGEEEDEADAEEKEPEKAPKAAEEDEADK